MCQINTSKAKTRLGYLNVVGKDKIYMLRFYLLLGMVPYKIRYRIAYGMV